MTALATALRDSAGIVARVAGGASLTAEFERLARHDAETPRAALIDLTHGTLRRYGRVQGIVRQLARREHGDAIVEALLWCSLYALESGRYADYTIVDQAVRACAGLERWSAKGYVNAVLRGFLRQRASLEARLRGDPQARYQHPRWWIEQLQAAYPEQWESVLAAGNSHPPMCLRVNRRRCGVAEYQAKLAAEGIAARMLGDHGLLVAQPVPVDRLPGFAAGEVSVQDAGAQRAAQCLELVPGQRVLDACAAPGGKAGHILELAEVELSALEADAARCARLQRNLERLGVRANVATADCTRLGIGGTGDLTIACSPTFPARPPESCGAIPTSSGCGALQTLPPSRRGKRRFSTRFGRCLARMVNCYMPPARYFRRRTMR